MQRIQIRKLDSVQANNCGTAAGIAVAESFAITGTVLGGPLVGLAAGFDGIIGFGLWC